MNDEGTKPIHAWEQPSSWRFFSANQRFKRKVSVLSMVGWCRERPMLCYFLFVAVFLLAETYFKSAAVVVACVPGWLALYWCGKIATWPADFDLVAMSMSVKIKQRLWVEAKWMFLTFVIFVPIAVYNLVHK